MSLISTLRPIAEINARTAFRVAWSLHWIFASRVFIFWPAIAKFLVVVALQKTLRSFEFLCLCSHGLTPFLLCSLTLQSFENRNQPVALFLRQLAAPALDVAINSFSRALRNLLPSSQNVRIARQSLLLSSARVFCLRLCCRQRCLLPNRLRQIIEIEPLGAQSPFERTNNCDYFAIV